MSKPMQRGKGGVRRWSPAAGVLSAASYRDIVDTLELPILVIEGDGTIRYAGGSLERDIGWVPEEVVGRNVIEFTPADQVERAIESLGELVQHDELGIGVPTMFAVIRPDGGLTWSAVGAVPLLDGPVEGIALCLLPWDAQLHFDESMSALLAGSPLETVFAHLAMSISVSLEAAGAVIHHGLVDGRFAASTGVGVPAACLEVGEGPWHLAAATGEPLYVASRDLPEAAARAAIEAGILGCWAIPLPDHSELAPAALSVWRWSEMSPVRAHEFVLTRSITYVQLALVRSAEHRALEYLADHDHLTGVANRALFGRTVEDALRDQGPSVTLLYCDLDEFKQINDERGHGAGDAVLRAAAERMSAVVDGRGVLARIGGDEFTVLVRDDITGATELARELLAAMARPFVLDSEEVEVGLSVGVAAAEADSTVDSLLTRADVALYRAKRQGGGRMAVA